MLNSFIKSHIMNEQTPTNTLNECTGSTGETISTGIINNPNVTEEDMTVVVDRLDDQINKLQDDEIINPMTESAIDFCLQADQVYLLTENAICKIKAKAIGLKALLEDASASADDKQQASEGIGKINKGYAGNIINSIIERIKQLISKFMKFAQDMISRASLFVNSITGWATKSGVDACKIISENSDKMRGYKYTVHNWNLKAVSLDNASGIFTKVNTLFSAGSVDQMKSSLSNMESFSINDIKRTLLKSMKLDMNAVTPDAIKSLLTGGELNKTGFGSGDANSMREFVSSVKTQYIDGLKSEQSKIVAQLNNSIRDLSKVEKMGTQSDDHQIASRFASKQASVLAIAVSLVNLITTAKMSAVRDMALEYIGIVNRAAKFAKSGQAETSNIHESITEFDALHESINWRSGEIPLTPDERKEIKERFENPKCSFVHTSKGYACYTHRCRSDFYESINKIPKAKVKFVESTG